MGRGGGAIGFFCLNLYAMNLSVLEIVALVVAGVSVAGTFVPRFPAVIGAFAAMVCMHFAGASYFDARTLIFWAIATVIVVGLGLLQPAALVNARQGHGYVAGGVVLGALLGYLMMASEATIILGGAVGAFLGALAYMNTPSSPRLSLGSAEFIQYLCAKGLPAVVATSMAALTMAVAL